MRHLTSLLPELGVADKRNSYVFLVSHALEVDVPPTIKLEQVMTGRWCGSLIRLFHDIVLIPKRIRSDGFDVVVSLTNFGPLRSPVPHILFQRNSLYFCEYYLRRADLLRSCSARIRRVLASLMMRRADIIVTPTNAMAVMIKRACPQLAGRRFQTLYHGFDKNTLILFASPSSPERSRANRPIQLIYPTHPGLHKGFEILFEIVRRLKERTSNFKLFLTTSEEEWHGVRKYRASVATLELEEQVVFLGNVPQREIGQLYASSDLMVYPSLCESFGFSMLEAMGFGVPIVAADTPVNREVCGTAAFYYPPLDARAGCDAVCAALEAPAAASLRRAAELRLKEFDWSWRRYATEFVDMLDQWR